MSRLVAITWPSGTYLPHRGRLYLCAWEGPVVRLSQNGGVSARAVGGEFFVMVRDRREQIGKRAVELLLGVADVMGGDAGHAVRDEAVEAAGAGHEVVELGIDEIFDGFAKVCGLVVRHASVSFGRSDGKSTGRRATAHSGRTNW